MRSICIFIIHGEKEEGSLLAILVIVGIVYLLVQG